MELLLCLAIIILSLVALVAVAGLLGIKLLAQQEDKKIEITYEEKGNFKN